MLKFFRRMHLYILAIPLLLVLLGVASNQAVLYANNDTFPVLVNPVKLQEMTENPETRESSVRRLYDGTVMIDDTHCVMTENTHLNLLADVFDFHDATYSIGDGLLEAGYWLWSFAPYVWAFALFKKQE